MRGIEHMSVCTCHNKATYTYDTPEVYKWKNESKRKLDKELAS